MALGTKRKAAQRLSVNPISLPSGAVQEFAGALAPEGWLMCDGAEVSKTTYAALYAVIADTYGTPVDSNNFVLPDLRGEFVRGLDDMGTAQGARGVDSGRALGSAQNDTTRRPRGTNFSGSMSGSMSGTSGGAGAHSHNLNAQVRRVGNNDFTTYSLIGGNRTGVNTNSVGNHTHSVSVSGSVSGSITGGGDAETRPRNCAMNFIIKA
jgi:microcystin-dependent protein